MLIDVSLIRFDGCYEAVQACFYGFALFIVIIMKVFQVA